MYTWQIIVLFALTACAIVCLLAIRKAVERLTEAIFFVRTELTRINAKLVAVEAVNKDDSHKPLEDPDPSLEAIETAISNFEKLKRIDSTESQPGRQPQPNG